jgi:adenine deaminase
MNVRIKSNLVDIFSQKVFPAEIEVIDGTIRSIRELAATDTPGQALDTPAHFILPGFVDAHVHIESSMLTPCEFARLAVVHGTVATVSDPHEIANVCGLRGVEYMLENSRLVPFKFYFGAPSCVPATVFETAGAVLDATAVKSLLERPEIKYLSEMMNFPGVLNKEPAVMEKIEAARRLGKPVDGHAPGLRGLQAKQYIEAGISTDHECFTKEEALDKLRFGMKIIIREGSAAKNFDALIDLLRDYPDQMMFCSDDKHPDSLVAGHINQLCARAVAKGIGLFSVLQAACLNPVLHYGLQVGLLRVGDPADFILVDNLEDFRVLATYLNGELVAEKGKSLLNPPRPGPDSLINHFGSSPKSVADFLYPSGFARDQHLASIAVIEALDGQLITNKLTEKVLVANGILAGNPGEDILKLVVVNRYRDAPIAKAFVKNFGLKNGAIASSVAHDSHNIVAVGSDDDYLCQAVNLILAHRGGICCVSRGQQTILPLPVAGLMSPEDGYLVAEKYTAIDALAKSLGSGLSAPFMTLSFMALLVIPHLKLSDLGLFDGDRFRLVG